MHNIIINSQNSNNNYLSIIYKKIKFPRWFVLEFKFLCNLFLYTPQTSTRPSLDFNTEIKFQVGYVHSSLTCPLGRD